jgi:hypothetical protein
VQLNPDPSLLLTGKSLGGEASRARRSGRVAQGRDRAVRVVCSRDLWWSW